MLQKNSLVDKQKSRGNNSHFLLPQILLLIFRYLSSCGDASARMKIICDLLDLLDSNPLNIEALMVLHYCIQLIFDIICMPCMLLKVPSNCSKFSFRNMVGMLG